MKKTVFILALVIFSAFAVKAENRPMIWKISGNGMACSSYLMGTHHQLCADYLDSIPGFYDLLATTSFFVMEVTTTEMAGYVKNSSYLPAGTGYEQLYSPEDFLFFSDKLKELFGNNLTPFMSLKPAVLKHLVEMRLLGPVLSSLAPQCAASMDRHLEQLAISQGNTVASLDEESDLFFNRQSVERQGEALIHLMKNDSLFSQEEILKEFIERYQAIEQAYRDGNPEELLAISENLMAMVQGEESKEAIAAREEYIAMGEERNRKWLEKLPALLESHSCFIAVGAMHLGGEKGIIRGLENLGYHVTRVYP